MKKIKSFKKSVSIVEVGARDGLQNEKEILQPDVIAEFIARLSKTGLARIEGGAFVSPKWVPQMAKTREVIEILRKNFPDVLKKNEVSFLVPNEKGFELAQLHQVREISLFAACSESFSLKNTNRTIDESFAELRPIMNKAKKMKLKIRGYLSTCFGCPYEGMIPEKKVIQLVKKMLDLGVYEVSIGDTIGVANVGQVESLFKKLLKITPAKKLAGHFHDTRGQALANILAAYKIGIRSFDSSLGGLGGCPYAPGAKGNVATEDVVYMFEGMGVQTGVNLVDLLSVNQWMTQTIKRKLPSRMGEAGILNPLGVV